jgi:hypothetical protein
MVWICTFSEEAKHVLYEILHFASVEARWNSTENHFCRIVSSIHFFLYFIPFIPLPSSLLSPSIK